jgi:hypothetical protein
MKELKRKIKDSGLQKAYIAKMIGISPAHFSMMLSCKATMPEETRNKVNSILNQASTIAI